MQAQARDEEDARKEVHRKTEFERLNSAIGQNAAALATYADMRRLPPGRYRPPVARVRPWRECARCSETKNHAETKDRVAHLDALVKELERKVSTAQAVWSSEARCRGLEGGVGGCCPHVVRRLQGGCRVDCKGGLQGRLRKGVRDAGTSSR